jgi:hypothetical protein
MRTSLWLLGSVALLGCGLSSAPGLSRTASGDASGGGSGSSVRPDPAPGGGGTLTAGTWDDSLNFPLFTAYRDAQQDRLVDFSAAEQQAAADASRAPTSALDLVLVIDTTSSMGDEITWLQTEFRSIAADVATAHPGVPQRWALVHYRDDGDEYVVRQVDFTSDLAAFQASLATLAANGGGDFPEAPERALASAANLPWDTAASTAKLVFWVADAPPHDAAATAFSSAVRALRAQGAHLYPVASSGIDERTEYAMRASAQLTQGRYLFLTDDSGVGDTHKEPTIPCYVVTRLDHAVERAIDSELAGTREEIDPARVLRQVGNPVDGQCTLTSGANAKLF